MKKFSFRTVCLIIACALVITAAAALVTQSGLFARQPSVEVRADNCYTETLHVTTDDNYLPYSFYDKEGHVSGHDVELVILIANELHMNLDLQFEPWNMGIRSAVAGRTDVLMTCDYSDTFSGTNMLLKTIPVSTDEFVVYSKRAVRSIEDLFSMRLAVMKNGNVTPYVELLRLTDRCELYKSNDEAMKAVENGEADCALIRYTVGEALLKEFGYKDISARLEIGQSNMCFGISRDNQALKARIDGAIETLRANGELDRLHDKWLTSFVHAYTFTELILNNVWILLVFSLLLMILFVIYTRIERSKLHAELDSKRYMEIVENLANDFECVNYIELHDDKRKDNTVLIRISDVLTRNIPGWAEETNFTKRVDMFMRAVIPPEEKASFSEMTRRETVLSKLREEGVYYVDLKAVLDGVPKYCQLKFSLVADENGQEKAVVLGFHNVDEQMKKEMESRRRLEEALRSAESANRSKTEFLFNMSHDIRTPMNAITGFTTMAKKHVADTETVADYLEKIDSSGKQLLALVNNVLEMARIESGKVEAEEKPGNIRQEYDVMTAIFREEAQIRGLTFNSSLEGIEHYSVYSDDSKINSITINIVNNAMKYTPEGGTIDFTLREIESRKPGCATYVLTVADTGMGMSEEFQKTLFDPFTREKTSTVSRIQGTGLGLSIVKRYVDLMGGDIEVHSAPGKGTRFDVTLDLRICETAEVPAEEIPVSHIDSFKDLRVLLVEDNELNREIALDILEEEGFKVEMAEDGSLAVDKMKEKGPSYYDFILMDIQMPVMNGYEATKAIRAMYPEAHIPIIAVSANAFEEDRRASKEAGMDDHVAKPIQMTELLGALAKYL